MTTTKRIPKEVTGSIAQYLRDRGAQGASPSDVASEIEGGVILLMPQSNGNGNGNAASVPTLMDRKMSVTEAARSLGLKPKEEHVVYGLISAKHIRSAKSGGRVYTTPAWLEQFHSEFTNGSTSYKPRATVRFSKPSFSFLN